MPREGMVHALVLLYGVLTSHGTLVDLRPDRMANACDHRAGQPHIYCVEGEQRVHVGYLKTAKPLADYRAADRAVRNVIRQGLFALQTVEVFSFRYHVDSLATLDKALATRWASTILDAPTRRRLQACLHKHPAAKIMMVDRMRLTVMEKR